MRSFLNIAFYVALFCVFAGGAYTAEDFTFIHTSDDHLPMGTAKETLAIMADIMGEFYLAPYDITVMTPSFVINSGDLTEFGPGRSLWEDSLALYDALGVPYYLTAGNHDNTWYAMRPLIAKKYGRPSYSFDAHGCHFIGLESASIHEPLESIGLEALRFLDKDLSSVDKDTPVFIFMHHGPNYSGYASKLEGYRILDLVRPFRSVVFMVGHGHRANLTNYEGVEIVQGGSTYGPPRCDRGWNVYSVQDDVLRVAFHPWDATAATKPLLESPLWKEDIHPVIEIENPEPNAVLENSLVLQATVDKDLSEGSYQIDDGEEFPVSGNKGTFNVLAGIAELSNGAHYLRLNIKDGDKKYHKTVIFYKEGPDAASAVWRTQLEGSSICTPTVAGQRLYVGGNDGILYIMNKRTGKIETRFQTGLDVAAQPLVLNGMIYFGSADGHIYAIEEESGEQAWKTSTESEEAVYSSPTTDGERVFFADDGGRVYSLHPATGDIQWTCKAPEYTIESQLYYSDGVVYAGCWDRYIYAVDAKTGQMKYRTLGAKCSSGGNRYYSPADNGPLVSNGKMFCTDRGYVLGFYKAEDGQLLTTKDNISGIGLSEDGKALYWRGNTKGVLTKSDLEGKVLWTTNAVVGRNPTSPTEADDRVYVCGNKGLLQCFDASDGKKLWEYQTTPQLYVYSSVAVDNGIAYVSGMDGSVVAVKAPRE